MTTYITSDLHFGHKNIITFCPDTRGRWADVTSMNEGLIRGWNEVVQPDDLTYILGDVAFCHHDMAAGYLNRLNGRKILIKGNHDQKLLTQSTFVDCFESVHDYLEIKHDKTTVCMFHYPIAEWNRMHHGSVHFYGHLHQGTSGLEKYRARNVGFDSTGQIVWRFEEAFADAMKGEIKSHH